MNELERLIGAVDRPGPSDQLDECVNALLAEKQGRPPVLRWRSALALIGTAACVGIIGFYCGRQSVIATADPIPRTITAPATHQQPNSAAAMADVVTIPLREDQLVGMFMRASEGEGLLGRGPVKIEITTSP